MYISYGDNKRNRLVFANCVVGNRRGVRQLDSSAAYYPCNRTCFGSDIWGVIRGATSQDGCKGFTLFRRGASQCPSII